MNLRGWEWLILLAIVLLLFGARRLPDLARSVGKSMKIFKSEVKDLHQDDPAEQAAPVAPVPLSPDIHTAATPSSPAPSSPTLTNPANPAPTEQSIRDDGEHHRS